MIEPKRYLEHCRYNAVYGNIQTVYFRGSKYYPKELTIWFDADANTVYSAMMSSMIGRSDVRVRLSEVFEDEVQL